MGPRELEVQQYLKSIEPLITEKCYLANLASFNYETNVTEANEEANVRMPMWIIVQSLSDDKSLFIL